LHSPRADNDARLVERQIRGVKEEHLTDLRVERIKSQPGNG
jgi:hypothetical protein